MKSMGIMSCMMGKRELIKSNSTADYFIDILLILKDFYRY